MIDNPDERDILLDEALKTYMDQAPPAGMERRLLARVHAAPPRWRIWFPAVAVVAAVCLLLTISLMTNPLLTIPLLTNPRGTPVRPAQPPPAASVPAIAASVQPVSPPDARRVVPARRRLLRRSRPQPGTLSEPEALSEGERTLLRFLAGNPEQAHGVLLQLAATDRPAPIEPLRIEPLSVPPIEVQTREMNP
jgi:hypothetical protein